MESAAGVLMLLPRWGRGMGGIYSTAHSLMHQLQKEKRPVACVLGAAGNQLSHRHNEHIKQLGVEILHPNTEDEEEPKSPEERVQDIHNIESLYEHIEPRLKDFGHIVTFSKNTRELTSYLMENSEASGCQLVVFHHEIDRSQEAITELARLARTAEAVFSLGNSTFRFLNTEMSMDAFTRGDHINNHLFIPNFKHLTCLRKDITHCLGGQNRIFVPFAGFQSDELARQCICAANLYNESLRRTHASRDIVEVHVQTDANLESTDQLHSTFKTCSEHDHVHQDFFLKRYCSIHDLAHDAKLSTIVIASGQFTESGYCGLEFLMNGHVTYIPQDCDVAEILNKASPGFAKLFFLPKFVGLTQKSKLAALQEWEITLHDAIEGKDNLHKKVCNLARDLENHLDFINSQKHLLKTFNAVYEPPQENEVVAMLSSKLNKDTFLDEGAIGKVYKVDQTTAVKVVDVTKARVNKVMVAKEIQIMARLADETPNENIIHFKGCHCTDEYIYILMELARESMAHFMKEREYRNLKLKQKADVMRQVFAGLEHLHSNRIVHQDVTPANILFYKELHVKVSDFGTARVKSSHTTKSTTHQSTSHADNPGTPYYQAREVQIEGRRAQPYSDVWAGCLVGTEWITGKKSWTFSGPNAHFLMKNQQQMPSQLSKIEPELQVILKDGMNYSARDRPCSTEIKQRLANYVESETSIKTPDIVPDGSTDGISMPDSGLSYAREQNVTIHGSTGEVVGSKTTDQMQACGEVPASVSLTPEYKEYRITNHDQFLGLKDCIIIAMGVSNQGQVAIITIGRVDVFTPSGRREMCMYLTRGCEPASVTRYKDTILVSDINNKAIHVHRSTDGEYVASIDLQLNPSYICSNGKHIWVYSKQEQRIHRLKISDQHKVLTAENVRLHDDNSSISRIAVNDACLAVCYEDVQRVNVYLHPEQLLYTYGTNQKVGDPRELSMMQDACLDENNYLYVAEYHNHRVVIVDVTGAVVGVIPVSGLPCYIDIFNNTLFVRCLRTKTIETFQLEWH